MSSSRQCEQVWKSKPSQLHIISHPLLLSLNKTSSSSNSAIRRLRPRRRQRNTAMWHFAVLPRGFRISCGHHRLVYCVCKSSLICSIGYLICSWTGPAMTAVSISVRRNSLEINTQPRLHGESCRVNASICCCDPTNQAELSCNPTCEQPRY